VQSFSQTIRAIILAEFRMIQKLYQQLWQQYFTRVNIVSRKNTKLHTQHIPKRYRKFLPEKMG
jgi:probable DNA metabolism protein